LRHKLVNVGSRGRQQIAGKRPGGGVICTRGDSIGSRATVGASLCASGPGPRPLPGIDPPSCTRESPLGSRTQTDGGTQPRRGAPSAPRCGCRLRGCARRAWGRRRRESGREREQETILM